MLVNNGRFFITMSTMTIIRCNMLKKNVLSEISRHKTPCCICEYEAWIVVHSFENVYIMLESSLTGKITCCKSRSLEQIVPIG